MPYALAAENLELLRHWRRRARIAELAGDPLRVTAAEADEIRGLRAFPPVVVLRPDGSLMAFGVEVEVDGDGR